MLRRLTLLGLLLTTSACAETTPLPLSGAAQDGAFATSAAIEPAGLLEDPPAPRTLVPGDVLHLEVVSLDATPLADTEVDAAGRVHLPLVGDVAVGGMTLTEAEKKLEEAFRRYDRFARVSVGITRSTGQRATVTGAVSKPGVVELPPDARLADVLALAGGPKSWDAEGETQSLADLPGGRLVRGGQALPVSLSKALLGDPHHNVRVRPGDVVFVPAMQGERISVLGEVGKPRVVSFRAGLRLSEALALAGGATRDADLADVRVVRGPLSAPRVYQANVRDLLDGQAPDVALAPGDIVYVTEHWLASATDVIARLTPALAMTSLGVALSK